eukprot:CAMPEP_0204449778 /NCGR_PEP_ID=MMETSP0470-20130426/100012_1 /ASSEMBLY_ACC=CAM_ASM_000385 /TAXON_ID=2969 /ORGANISM="Oxyrrhis marina" /LENGTH=447 /DNA_ID=CAMNT_0051449601 /DNA_START=15 /DNA_END=1355 /DNA_ORIENTATION=+
MPRQATVATKKTTSKPMRKPVAKPVDPVAASVKAVLAQLQKCTLHDSALEILVTGATLTLPLEQENRTPMHDQVMAWVAQHLQDQEQQAATALTTVNQSLATMDSERAQLAAAVAAAQEAQASAVDHLKAKATESAECLSALNVQREADADGLVARREKQAEAEAVVKVRNSVVGTQTTLSELMTGTVEEKQVKKQVQRVHAYLKKDEGFDGSLLSTLPAVLQKPAAAMSQFEQVAAGAAVDWLSARVAGLDEQLGAARAAVAEVDAGLTVLVGLEKQVKKQVQRVHAFLKKAEGFDGSLLSALPGVLQKPAGAMSQFEQAAAGAAVDWLRARVAGLDEQLGAARAAVAEVDTGLTVLVGLEKSHADAVAAEEAATQALISATAALEAAEEKVVEFDGATEEKRSERTAAEEVLEAVKASIGEFEKLRVRSNKARDVEMGDPEVAEP